MKNYQITTFILSFDPLTVLLKELNTDYLQHTGTDEHTLICIIYCVKYIMQKHSFISNLKNLPALLVKIIKPMIQLTFYKNMGKVSKIVKNKIQKENFIKKGQE